MKTSDKIRCFLIHKNRKRASLTPLALKYNILCKFCSLLIIKEAGYEPAGDERKGERNFRRVFA